MFKKRIKITLNEEDFIPFAKDLFKEHNYLVLKQSQKLAEEYIKLISQQIKYRHEHGATFVSFSRYSDKIGEKIYRFFCYGIGDFTIEITALTEDIVFTYFRKIGYKIEWQDSNIRNERQIYVSWNTCK